ncbi:MAG: hypothetical protein ACNA7J_00540 [Wenzhouxiangella sp.]
MKRKTLFFVATLAGIIMLPPALAQDWFVSPTQPHGHVSGAIDQPARGLYRVEITEINGELVGRGRSEGVWLKPGDYTIQARRAQVRTDFTGAVGRSSSQRHIPENNTVELTVEEGKTYYLALDTSSRHRADWQVVVWKTE